MNDHHIVVGAGPLGREVAARLVSSGSQVTVVTRSGRSTGIADAEHVAVDAADPDRLSATSKAASVIYNCANPADYTKWSTIWPPLAASFLTAATRTGAVLATAGSLYPYGPKEAPMTEGMGDTATDVKGVLRARMWADAKAAHEAGRVRAVEVRGSDYVGPGVGNNGHVTRVLPAALKGKGVRVIGSANEAHSWTDVQDMARTLIAAAQDEDAHGKIWHAPVGRPRTQAEAINDVLASVGRPPVAVKVIPRWALTAAAKVSPLVRHISQMDYQFTRPYILDDQLSRAKFGIEPTPWVEVCRRTASSFL